MTDQTNSIEMLSLVSEIVAAYVSNNELDITEVPAFIQKIYGCLNDIGSRKVFLHDRPEPVVAIEDSIQSDYIVCLEDGRKLKMLKRHLKTAYNMTPEQYRERWGLSADYPMVAPNYAKQRSKLAKNIGLGTRERRRDIAA